jgi:hypothetical protein
LRTTPTSATVTGEDVAPQRVSTTVASATSRNVVNPDLPKIPRSTRAVPVGPSITLLLLILVGS